jgi:hypothetical protein
VPYIIMYIFIIYKVPILRKFDRIKENKAKQYYILNYKNIMNILKIKIIMNPITTRVREIFSLILSVNLLLIIFKHKQKSLLTRRQFQI